MKNTNAITVDTDDALPLGGASSGILAELAPVIGIEAVNALTQHFGGIEIYIPRASTLDENHPIAIALSIGKAIELCNYLGMGKLNIPMGANSTSHVRKIQIKSLTQLGYSAAKIAQQLGITERWVRVRLAEIKMENLQGDLFASNDRD